MIGKHAIMISAENTPCRRSDGVRDMSRLRTTAFARGAERQG